MDADTCRTLTKILGKREIEKIPVETQKKLEKYCESRYEEFTTTKVLYNTTQKNIDKLRKENEKLSSKTQDYGVKIEASQVNVNELRTQLERSNSEIARLTTQITQQETETNSYRKERNDIIDERDELLKSLEHKDATLKRMQSDMKTLEAKLQSALSDKCDAIAHLAEIAGKEQSFEYKEKLMEKQKEHMNIEIANLTENLNKTMAELLTLRQSNTSDSVQAETDLTQETEELRIANSTIRQLTETNQLLTKRSEENVRKLKEQVNESVKLAEVYQMELEAKIKLAELYKGSCDDLQAQTNELTVTAKELQRMLHDTTNRCGALEGNIKDAETQKRSALEAKDEIIRKLEEELKTVNDLLKTVETDSAEAILEKFAPSAAAANRLLKGNLSLTEIYTRYHNAIDDVNRKDGECVQIKMELERITLEYQERVSDFERQQDEYKKLLAANDELTQKVNNFAAERDRLQGENVETRSKFEYLERENAKLTSNQADLARQICHLLHEIESSKGETTSDQRETKSFGFSAKKLVTFDNIVEMQENNHKLLMKVRDLSSKLEAMEEIQNTIEMQCYESKIAVYERRLDEAEQSRRANEDLLGMCLKQKDRFKQLYFEAMKDLCKKPLNVDSVPDEQMEIDAAVGTNVSKNPPIDVKDKKFSEIEHTLQDKMKELKNLKEEYNEYRKESSVNFQLLKEQFDTMQSKVRELHAANCQLSTQANFANEQIKIHLKDIAIYKKQIETLEERNKMYDRTISKHEMGNKQLRDETMNTVKKLSAAESQCDHLQRECRRLMDVNSSLEIEHQALHRQKLTQSILQSNLEMIKVSSERSEFEGRMQLELRLDEAARECSALRRQLEEENSRFREEASLLKRQADSSIKKLTDEQKQVETLQSKLSQTREQMETKNQQFNDLSKKLQEALTPCKYDNPISKGNKKIKDLELQLKNKTTEIEQLNKQLKSNVEKITKLSKQASDWEDESKLVKENFDTWKAKMTADLQACRLSETNLKSQVEELQTEIRLQITGSHLKADGAVTQSKAQTELKEALLKISENNRELRSLRSECHKLKINLQTIENKYSNEMQVHSSDLQALTLCKDELNKCQEQMDQLRADRDTAMELLTTSRLELETINKQSNEDRQKLEQKLENVNSQNTTLHDLLQAQHNKSSSTDTLNDFIANSSILSRTLTDDGVAEISSEKLFSVIKFLRREKDITVAEVEILKTENNRLISECEQQKKRLNELSQQLTAAQVPVNEANVISTAKYEDLMRKVETLNAMTDSNIYLREEKDVLNSKVKELTERVTKLEADLCPLQEKNRELLAKNEEQTQINNMLVTNVENWRKRASDFVERNNKNPEDFKRLQNERENLAKMLTSEKENLRQVNEELSSLKAERTRLEQELATATKQVHTATDERKKMQNELNNLKQTNVRLTQEIIEAKGTILKKEDELKTAQSELSPKDAQLTDSKSKEIQIRRIAKKYKDSYNDLKTKEDERDATKSSEESASVQTKKSDDLSSQTESRQEEIDQLRLENSVLTEANRQINRDYQTSKSQLQTCEQSRSEHDSIVAALKSQLEAKVKELHDQDASRQETIARLTRENETLNTRVNQFHRQFPQQGSKPSTSSGTIEKSPSDPARTANVKPMATPSAQQSATVNPRRGGDTPLASIRPMSVQNSRTAAVLPTSQTSNIATVQGSSSGSVTTALVPPQQQVHTTGNMSTAEAMSSSPTSSHTDYMPATSSAVVVAVPPMGSASAESTQEAESLSANTNESSSSTSSQAVLQQQTVALVSPRVEVAPQNVLTPSQQAVDQNQAASTSGSSSSFLTAMSSHHQASSSNTVTTTQAGGHKRPRDAEGDSSTGVEESSGSEKTSPQNKRIRLGEQTFQGVTESGLDVEYQVPTSSQRDQEDDVVAVDSEDEDDDGMDDEATADVDETFDAENGDTDEIESLGQDEGEGHDIDEDNVRNDTNEVDVEDSSDAPNQSSGGLAASSGVRANLSEVIELSPLSQETQQIQMISSGSDAGPSGQGNNWRQIQPPTRQQQSLVIQQAYEEMGDDSIVPSTPTLYVARRADGFSEAVSSPHPIVPHGSRFTFNESGASSANRAAAATLGSTIEGMDDTRMDLNLLDQSGDGGQSSSIVTAVQDADNQRIVSVDEISNENKEADQTEPVAGPSGQVGQIIATTGNDQKTFDGSASTSHITDDKNISNVVEVEDQGTDGVSSEGEKPSGQDGNVIEEGREAEASILPTDNSQLRNTRSRRNYRARGVDQRPTPITWEQGRYHQMSLYHQQQQHGNVHRGSHNRGQIGRGNRGRSRRPYRS